MMEELAKVFLSGQESAENEASLHFAFLIQG